MSDSRNSKYSCKIITDNTEDIITCAENETIIEGAEREGWALPYSCLKGVCMTCEGTLLSGSVISRNGQEISGPRDNVRFCISKPSSNIEIRPQWASKLVEKPARKTLKVTVFEILQPATDVYILELRLPIGVRVKFRAGQYLKAYLDENKSRSYSMANPPYKNQEIQLHIRYIPGGEFSKLIKNNIKKGSSLRIELPYGNFYINDDSERPIILVASGTGFAPMKSMIENQIYHASKRPVTLYWGTNKPDDMYLMSLPFKWAEEYPWFKFYPVISEPDKAWKGRTGFVHQAVLSDHADLSEYDVYACGNPHMIAAAKDDLVNKANLISENFHCDIFVPTGE